MDNKLKQAKEKLAEWEGLMRIEKSQDYQLYLKPILEKAFQNKWPDPSKAMTYEEFHKQYAEQYGRAMAYQEITTLLENAGTLAKNLAEQMKNPTKDYSYGQKPTTNKP